MLFIYKLPVLNGIILNFPLQFSAAISYPIRSENDHINFSLQHKVLISNNVLLHYVSKKRTPCGIRKCAKRKLIYINYPRQQGYVTIIY